MSVIHFLEKIRNHIQAIMSGTRRSFFAEKILYGFSLAYAGGLALRAFLYRKNILRSLRPPCFVISAGNITAGGTGKTPMTLYLAKLLRSMGYRSVILSRGYRGKFMKKGGIVSDGISVLAGPEQAGDEPYMMALALENVPVLAGRNRCRNAMLAIEKFQPDVILLDDGFQHLRLKRDLDLVLLDCESPLGNGYMLPRGMLRESVSALARAHVFILTRCHGADSPVHLPDVCAEMPVFRTSHIPYLRSITDEKGLAVNDREKGNLSALRDQHVFVFSGIAGNDLFVRTVKDLGCIIAGTKGFPDHHPYSGADMQEIRELAKEKNASLLVTTEKDFVRLPFADRKFSLKLAVVGIEISFGDQADVFAAFIREQIRSAEKQ